MYKNVLITLNTIENALVSLNIITYRRKQTIYINSVI